MIKTEMLERVEGEARLDYTFKDGIIDFVDIRFLNFRGMENILVGKAPMDALIITPRVCGICGQAHLMTTVQALENCYQNAGVPLEITPKAKLIREFTLNLELIQNHIKWLYLVMIPQMHKITNLEQKNSILKASHLSANITKAIALFSGQWPHSSFVVPGGVVCDPTYVEINQARGFLYQTIKFFEAEIIKLDLESFLSIEKPDQLLLHSGDFIKLLNNLYIYKMDTLGQSSKQFIAFGESSLFQKGKVMNTRPYNVNTKFIKEQPFDASFSYAKNISYKNKYYEVGPLARAMVNKTPLIKNFYALKKDSALVRVVARIRELGALLYESNEMLGKMDLNEASFINPNVDINELSAKGTGVTEAARGSLVHNIEISEGKIKHYNIITPTQWNLANGTKEKPGIAQQAMIGLNDQKVAEFIFRTFDVCSVCTTH